jgi:hypothetical protein
LEFLGKKLYYVVEDIEVDNSSPGSLNFFHNFSTFLVHSGIWWDCSAPTPSIIHFTLADGFQDLLGAAESRKCAQ